MMSSGRLPSKDGGGRRRTSGDGGPPIVCDWLAVATPTAANLYKNDSSSG